MASMSGIPSASSVFSAYASLSASVMLFQTAMNQLVPRSVQNYIYSAIRYYFKPKSSNLVLLIEETDGLSTNEIFTAAETYLYSKIDSSIESLKISKRHKETSINVKFAKCEKIADIYEGVKVVWRFSCVEKRRGGSSSSSYVSDEESGNISPQNEKRYFQMSFNKEYKDMVMNSYIPYILQKSKRIKEERRVVKLHTLSAAPSYAMTFLWESINLEHPSTFETLAMDTELKKAIMEDMDRFVKRKDFYRKVGKAWKRGYLLHGPPGTGKSSLIAAMANYLKFDIYDLELSNIRRDSDLRKLLLRTANRSILVIEDIDCSVELPDRRGNSGSAGERQQQNPENGTGRSSTLPHVGFTLSGLLNFIDGLWSCCGDERIIIFTTNNKDRLDPALLRPGRMDMHIAMSYLTRDGFRTLATNYLNIRDPHWRFDEIEEMIKSMDVTPAEVAEELMKSDDPDVSLEGLSQFLDLKRKKMEDDGGRDEEGSKIADDQAPKGKRIKLGDERYELHCT